MSQYICTRLGSIAGIIVTYLLATIVIESASSITVVLILLVEEIVHGQSHFGRFYPRQLERVGEMQVAYKIGIQYLVFLTF